MRQVVRFCAGMALGLVASAGSVFAQNYNSAGILSFGVFGQYSKSTFDIARPGFAATMSPAGVGGGAVVGYDYRLSRSWVLGIEADAATDDTKSKTDNNRGFNSNLLATVRGRVGYNLSPIWMIYGTGGLATLGAEYHGTPASASTSTPNHYSEMRFGFAAGGGTQVDLEGITLFAEYLHTGFDQWAFTPTDLASRYTVDMSSDVVRVGVKFKIGYDYDADTYRRDARRY